MKIARDLAEIQPDGNSVVTVGTFDGIHRAHQEIIREVVRRARDRGGRAVVVTFDPHPREVVASGKGSIHLLSSLEERIHGLEVLGVDVLLIVRFTFEFSRMGSREFYQQYVVKGVGASEVVVGYDHMFGRDREAGTRELLEMGREFGFSVHTIPEFMVHGEKISSTVIRRALAAGEVDRAAAWLGRPYGLDGVVVEGDRRGRQLGFPTANIEPTPANKVIPGHGIYVVRAAVDEFSGFGMMNLGVRPTIADNLNETLEVYLFDFSGDIYGRKIRVEFLHKLRDERKFPGLDALVAQIKQDAVDSRRFIEEYGRNK